MEIKFKKLTENAVSPKRAHDTDAGADLVATSVNATDKYIEYGTGLAVQIPNGYFGLLVPRSSVTNKDMMLKNSLGIIDQSFRGELRFRYTATHQMKPDLYNVGDRVGQLVILPYAKTSFVEVDKLTETDRGSGGYGSTGK